MKKKIIISNILLLKKNKKGVVKNKPKPLEEK